MVHKEKHNCTTFFDIYKKETGVPGELIKAAKWDAFKFSISKEEGQFIAFNSYWNCWTQCHKPFFTDSRQPMMLNMRVSGPNVAEQIIRKAISVQQNPGRGAKVVSQKKPNEETPHGYIESIT